MSEKSIILDNFNIHNGLSFKVKSYGRNYDFFTLYDSFFKYDEGVISLSRNEINKQPKVIGEFSITKWNFELADKLNIDLCEFIKLEKEDSYSDFIKLMDSEMINLNEYSNVVLVNSLIVQENYRKHGISGEFFEYLYRTYYNNNTLVLVLVKPLQSVVSDYLYYLNEKIVKIKPNVEKSETIEIPAFEYYGVNNLSKFDDTEMNDYKLFNVGVKGGLSRIGDTYLFKINEDAMLNRILYKYNDVIYNDSEFM